MSEELLCGSQNASIVARVRGCACLGRVPMEDSELTQNVAEGATCFEMPVAILGVIFCNGRTMPSLR